MSECINDFFIHNGEVKNSSEFQKVYPKSTKLLYEVLRIIEKKPLFLKEHIKRLENSTELSNVEIDLNKKKLSQYITKLIQENQIVNGNIKIIIDANNTLVYSVKHSYPSNEMYEKGVKTIFYFGERENPNAKVINNSFREIVNEELRKADAYEAILVDHEGNITEGSRSNIFMLKGKIVYTAPVKNVLPGITREKIILACKRLALEVLEENVKYSEIKYFDGVFISGTSPKVLPVNSIANDKIYSENNEIIKGIMGEFNEIINEDLALRDEV
ncbi:aminotransferase class IV [Clostridium sp.]|uniref:aminotransferase class IV n=1 Tax=Clostridium sp. TaxID=1506 RepID=UPI002FC67A85